MHIIQANIMVFLSIFFIINKFDGTNRCVSYCNQFFYKHTSRRKYISVNTIYRYSFFSSTNIKSIKTTLTIFERKFKENILSTYKLIRLFLSYLILLFFANSTFFYIFLCAYYFANFNPYNSRALDITITYARTRDYFVRILQKFSQRFKTKKKNYWSITYEPVDGIPLTIKKVPLF